jgi:anion-transporting  ArsA/GET3 family ATPase
VLVVTIDDRPGLARLLGAPEGAGSSYEGDLVIEGRGPGRRGSVHLRAISAAEALQDYLGTQGLARLAKRLVSTGVVDVVASAAPGIDDLLVLGKVKHLVGLAGESGPHDIVIVDGPAAGHALSLLRSPHAMAETVRGGPLRSQAIEIRNMMRDPDKCRVVLVSLPESTPVSELVETAAILTNEIGVTLGPVVVNGVDHADDVEELVAAGSLLDGELGDAARFRARRCEVHRREVGRIDELIDQGHLELPYLTTGAIDHKATKQLAKSILEQMDGAS